MLDNVFVPWEDVFVYRDIEKFNGFFPRSGFVHRFGLARLHTAGGEAGFHVRAAGESGSMLLACDDFRGVQVNVGECIAWRNLFWGLSDAMCRDVQPWIDGAVLPNMQTVMAYRVVTSVAYPRIKQIIEEVVASGADLPAVNGPTTSPCRKSRRISERYLRGSYGMDHRDRIKLMKLLWDAIGTEFGGRHELYERNYAGNHEDIRIQAMFNARGSGALDAMVALAEECMADYDEKGWVRGPWINPAADMPSAAE